MTFGGENESVDFDWVADAEPSVSNGDTLNAVRCGGVKLSDSMDSSSSSVQLRDDIQSCWLRAFARSECCNRRKNLDQNNNNNNKNIHFWNDFILRVVVSCAPDLISNCSHPIGFWIRSRHYRHFIPWLHLFRHHLWICIYTKNKSDVNLIKNGRKWRLE